MLCQQISTLQFAYSYLRNLGPIRFIKVTVSLHLQPGLDKFAGKITIKKGKLLKV